MKIWTLHSNNNYFDFLMISRKVSSVAFNWQSSNYGIMELLVRNREHDSWISWICNARKRVSFCYECFIVIEYKICARLNMRQLLCLYNKLCCRTFARIFFKLPIHHQQFDCKTINNFCEIFPLDTEFFYTNDFKFIKDVPWLITIDWALILLQVPLSQFR